MVVFIAMQCLGWYHVVTPEQNEPPQPEIAGGGPSIITGFI